MNDQYETQAIIDVFGESANKLSVSSTKGVTGHCVGAAGGIEAALTVKALMHQTVPPTANFTEAEEEMTLDYTPNEPKRGKFTCPFQIHLVLANKRLCSV